MRALRIVAVVLLLAVGAFFTRDLWLFGRGSPGIDFYQFWVGGQVAGQVEDFYSPATGARVGEEYLARATQEEQSPRRVYVAQVRRKLEWYSTPLQFTLFSFCGRTYEGALLAFQCTSLAAFLASVAILARTFGYTPLRALLLFDYLVYFFGPLYSDVQVASVNALVLLALSLATWATARGRWPVAGALLGLALVFKPYAALALPVAFAHLLALRRFRELRAHALGALAGAAVGLLLGAWGFRSFAIWIDWLRALRSMPDSIITAELGNYSLLTLAGAPGLGALFAALLLGLVALAFRVRKGASAECALGVGVLISFLAAPLVWEHYLLLTLPLLAWLARPGGRLRCASGVAALLLIGILPWAPLLSGPAPRAVALAVNAGMLLALAAALCLPHAAAGQRAGSGASAPGPAS